MTEEVDHPDHYGGDTPYEVIKVLRAWNLEGAKWFCWGNVIKYAARAHKKGGLKDYEKAAWYAGELASIEAELATRPKLKSSEIPVVIPGPGRYHIAIDWEKRTYKLVREDTQFVGGGTGSANSVSSDGGGGGGEYRVSGGLEGRSTVQHCLELGGCHGGYHARRCPLNNEVP